MSTIRLPFASKCGALGLAEFDVVEATDGTEGAETIGRLTDLAAVICDVNIPRMSGLENQLLGRVKNQMLARGVEISPSTPIALRGEHLSPVLRQRLVAELFTAEGGIVCVRMDCEFDEGFELAEETAGEAAPMSEGEPLLF
ncbi:MAG TPA: hypothetical protein VHW01_28920 [Polyangiaceae bacterium]|nr:hypothetical protein [Polyangiaceae bacterium]